jgi:microcystin-dependent protein
MSDQVSATQSFRPPMASKKFFIPQSSITTAMLTQAALIALMLPSSIIVEGGGDTPPTGYLTCDGSAVSCTTYPVLFSQIGFRWGNPGGGNFNVPDLRGVFTRMVDTAGVKDPDYLSRTPLGTGTSAQVGSYQADQLISHDHFVNAYTSNDAFTSNVPVSGGYGANYPYYTSASGGNETRPKNVYVNKFIKY